MNVLPERKIIGGKFGLPKVFGSEISRPKFLEGDPILLFNARSAIKLVLDWMKPRTIWLPSYLCPTIISAIPKDQININFYPINPNLCPADDGFVKQLKEGDAFLFIDYFGFPFDRSLIEEVHWKGAILLHDCSQALFYDWEKTPAEFCFYSPRKFLGVPDGGILHVKNDLKFEHPSLSDPPEEVLYPLLKAVIIRREFDIWGGDREWNTYFHLGEGQLTPGNYSMSELTRILLKNAFDYTKIKSQRRINYQYLMQKLSDLSIFPNLNNEITPLGFPVRLNNRDFVQKRLFKYNIYPPIHWDISQAIPKEFDESHKLSQQIMTLPCDQRYDQGDMDNMANIIKALVA